MPVSYLPSQIDGGAFTTPLNFRDSPFQLLWADIKLVASLLLWIPHIFLPLKTTSSYSELYPSWMNMRDLALHVILGTLGIIFLLVVVPLGIAAPGVASAIFVLLCCGIVWACCIPLRAKTKVLNSKVALDEVDVRPEEAWVFVNGVTAGEHWLQGSCSVTHKISSSRFLGNESPDLNTTCDSQHRSTQLDIQTSRGRYPQPDLRRCLRSHGVPSAAVFFLFHR